MLVEARDLRKLYPTRRGMIAAVDGLDLEVRAGKFLAVCGRSGSGKSTLLGMVGGLCRPTEGTVRVDGTDLWALGPDARARFRARRFGFLFQFAGLLPNLRAADNIALPALLAGEGYDPAYSRARELLGQVGLLDRWDAYPGELSGGQQRRIAIARALINRPLLLLADEPTNDLDEQSEQEVLGLLRQLHRTHNTTLIVVTHDPQLARQADCVVTLRAGKVASVSVPGPVLVAEPQLVATGGSPVACQATGDAGGAWGGVPSPQTPLAAVATPVAAEPTPLGEGLGRFLLGFVGWALLIVSLLWGTDYVTARFQRQLLQEKQTERQKVQELALQHLRADINEVTYQAGGGYEVGIFLQNFDPGKPFFVLGPSLRVFVQVKQNWQEVSTTPIGFSENSVQEVAEREVVRFAFRADLAHFDELLKGYMHVRITNVMVVSASAEPGTDIFQRTDDYYVYLKPQNLSEDEVRRRNGWKEKSLVPRWIGMPAH